MEKIYHNKFFQIGLFLAILIWGLYLQINNLENKYSFNWDQETDAYKVMAMVEERKPTLIGPRVISDAGFFLGPYHYYFLLPFYLIFRGNPIAGAVAAIVVSVLNMIIVFMVSRKMFDTKTAFMASFLVANIVTVTSWNVMYASGLSVILFYLFFKLLREGKYLNWGAFLLGLSINIHASFGSLIPVLILTVILSKKKFKIKQLIFALLLLFLPFTPLILFDLRHHFLNSTKVIEFVFGQGLEQSGNPWLFLRSFWRGISFAYLPIGGKLIYILERFLSLLAILVIIWRAKTSKEKLLLILWMFLPLIILSFYKGNIPEYYYISIIAILPIFVSRLLSTTILKPIVVVFLIPTLAYLTLTNINYPTVSLADKKQIVSFLINQKTDESFNVSYDLPLGWDNGYEYLFKYYSKLPDRTPHGHLYSIVSLPTNQKGNLIYQSGVIGLIRR